MGYNDGLLSLIAFGIGGRQSDQVTLVHVPQHGLRFFGALRNYRITGISKPI